MIFFKKRLKVERSPLGLSIGKKFEKIFLEPTRAMGAIFFTHYQRILYNFFFYVFEDEKRFMKKQASQAVYRLLHRESIEI